MESDAMSWWMWLIKTQAGVHTCISVEIVYEYQMTETF